MEIKKDYLPLHVCEFIFVSLMSGFLSVGLSRSYVIKFNVERQNLSCYTVRSSMGASGNLVAHS